jgi:hypothetical protein
VAASDGGADGIAGWRPALRRVAVKMLEDDDANAGRLLTLTARQGQHRFSGEVGHICKAASAGGLP